MEKKVQYDGKTYVIRKENDDITIKREENGILIDIDKKELDEILTFIGGRYVINTTTEKDNIREDIDSKIKSGEIKTIDQIEEILNNTSLNESEKEELKDAFRVTLDNQIVSDITAEEISEYKDKITEKLNAYRKPNEFLLSEFSMVNGIMHHRLVMMTTMENGDVITEELETKTFDYNQRLFDYLIDPSVQEFASSAEPLSNEYQIETSIAGDMANYSFVGANNTAIRINDISKPTAERLKKLVEDTKVEHKTYDGKQTEENINAIEQNYIDSQNYDDVNEIYEVDDNGERVMDKPWVRVRKDRTKDKKYGFINWKFWLTILAIITVGMFFLTKYVILK